MAASLFEVKSLPQVISDGGTGEVEDQTCSPLYLLLSLPLTSCLPTRRQRQHFMHDPDEIDQVVNVKNQNFILALTDLGHLDRNGNSHFSVQWLYLEETW